MKIEIILADDHAIMREGIKSYLERKTHNIAVIAEASNGRDVLKIALKHKPDVYVMDIAMPLLNGIETAACLMKKYPKSRIIILTMHDDKASVEKALHAGVSGYVLKECVSMQLVTAIQEVYAGRVYLCPQVSKYLVDGYLRKVGSPQKNLISLTLKEKEVLQLIAEGFANKEIARKLELKYNTIRVHRTNIMKKLDLHSTAELTRYALKEGLSNL